MLKSDQLMAKQIGQQFTRGNDIKKVNLGMARLLTVVNERKRLRNLYRAHLEDQYIAQCREVEAQALIEAAEEPGSNIVTPDMQTERLIGYINRRNEQFSNIRKEISKSMAGVRTGMDGEETGEKIS